MPLQSKVNWYKIGVFAAIAIVLFYAGCRYGSGGKQLPTVVTKIDTVVGKNLVTIIRDTVYKPKISNVVIHHYDTTKIFEENFCSDTAIYSDTISVKYGKVIINDTISENTIHSRGFKIDQTLPPTPTIVKTAKETITLPKRSIFYLGFSGTGSKQNYFYSIGSDVSLKLKNDKIYSIGASLTIDNQILFGLGIKFPIKIK